MREFAALRMVWRASAAWMVVEMSATWCVRKLHVGSDMVGFLSVKTVASRLFACGMWTLVIVQ